MLPTKSGQIKRWSDDAHPEDGPTGFITTTTQASLHPENETRLLSVNVRDDPDQTSAIMASLAEQASSVLPAAPEMAHWIAYQEWLERVGSREATIPFAPRLAAMTNPAAVRMRRDFDKILTLIRTYAMLHQGNRESIDGKIVATLEDYAAVYELVSDLISEGVEQRGDPTVRQTVEAVTKLQEFGSTAVSVNQIAGELGLDKSAASRRVTVAREQGYL